MAAERREALALALVVVVVLMLVVVVVAVAGEVEEGPEEAQQAEHDRIDRRRTLPARFPESTESGGRTSVRNGRGGGMGGRRCSGRIGRPLPAGAPSTTPHTPLGSQRSYRAPALMCYVSLRFDRRKTRTFHYVNARYAKCGL